VSKPRLDAEYYLSWASDIAGGDLLGRHRTIAGEPFLLNPLYAYVIAPLVGVFGTSPASILVFQTFLAGATAWLAAAAARRFAGDVAGAVAGLAVAFSAPLVHLDGYVAVSGLAAFLVAGTCFACAPPQDGERGHGPVAAGVWLGLSLLARPVTLFALPFVAWLSARREARPGRATLLFAAPIVVCAGLSFARNVAVSGEPVVFTAANGQNLYLGNNAAARRTRGMFTDEFRFAPREMHEDAKLRIGHELGREPTRSEVSDRFSAMARAEFAARPGESIAWYAQKARWFFSPAEPASSADIDWDLRQTPILQIAFVPTFLLAALAAAGIVVLWKRRDLVLGPGGLVFAHLVACTLTFPLSHYRAPAVPAMAVLAGCAVAAAWDGLRVAGKGRAAALVAVTAGGVALVGWIDPQPRYRREQLLHNSAVANIRLRRFDLAERYAREANAIDPQSIMSWALFLDIAKFSGRTDEAVVWAQRLVDAQPWSALWRADLARAEFDAGKRQAALARMDALVAEFPWNGMVRERRGEIRALAGDAKGAREDFTFAKKKGVEAPPWALLLAQ
jgi:4-amino-4-deoxy-L-arabinose transferase-like glycosyltransferase